MQSHSSTPRLYQVNKPIVEAEEPRLQAKGLEGKQKRLEWKRKNLLYVKQGIEGKSSILAINFRRPVYRDGDILLRAVKLDATVDGQ